MKNELIQQDIYFVIQPLHFVSKVLGLSSFHIDPKHKRGNERVSIVSHNILVTFMIITLLYGFYNSILYAIYFSEPIFNLFVRAIWTIHIVALHSTSILALISTVTRNGNHITRMLSIISKVDSKLLQKRCKRDVYTQQRSHVITQLVIEIILFGIASASCTYSFCNGTWTCSMYMISQTLCTVINNVKILQYVIIVLLVKHRYRLMKQLLSESVMADDTNCLNQTGHCNSHKTNKIFLAATHNLKINRSLCNLCAIQDLQIVHSELYDLIQENNNRYGILIILDIITILTSTVPTTYLGVIILKEAIFNNDNIKRYFKGIGLLCLCVFELLTLLWVTMCCNSTVEEVHSTFVYIQKLLLYPNIHSWTVTDLKSFSYQLKNVNIEFNILGFFNLNLKFLCASVGVICTYALVLNQFN
jgi:hypothetical protein